LADLEELIQVVEAIPAALRDRAMTGDTWTPRDVLAHITAWQEAALDRLAGAGPKIDGDAAIDAWNAAARERWAGVEWDQIVVRLRESRARLTERAGPAPPAWLHAWTEVHYDDHLADLRAAAGAGLSPS
jgi:hypothetical protein